MYNNASPSHAELPSSQQLRKSTFIAFISAAVILVTVVLPAEYAIDPTGIGRVLQLTEMGEIKTQLAQEAEQDRIGAGKSTSPIEGIEPVPVAVQSPTPPVQPSAAAWKDETSFILKAGEGTEIKLRMTGGAKATFHWSVQGGEVNYDTHGDALGRSVSYEKGRGVAEDKGELIASFTGNHGWFWRNRGNSDVTVVLRTGGDYAALKHF